jgi:DNA-binding transcriptional LysR family regulator
LVQAADELDREVRRRRAPGSGQLVVGAGPYPGDTIVPVALTRFVVAHPLVRVRVLIRGDWDELLRRLRSREFDFFVAETSTLEGENDLDIEPLSPHPAYFVVRREHPLVRRSAVRAEHTFQYPFVALSRYPPRILAPMLASRRGADAARPQRPFPAVELTSLAAMKRILASSDAVAALTLPCVRDEVTHGTLVVLGTEPWAVSRYGLVRLKGLAPSKHAAQFRDCLIDAEAELVREEAQLIGRLAPRGAPRSREAKARPSRASRKIRK